MLTCLTNAHAVGSSGRQATRAQLAWLRITDRDLLTELGKLRIQVGRVQHLQARERGVLLRAALDSTDNDRSDVVVEVQLPHAISTISKRVLTNDEGRGRTFVTPYVVGKERTGTATETVCDDHDLLRLKVLGRLHIHTRTHKRSVSIHTHSHSLSLILTNLDLVTKLSAVVNVYEASVVAQLATTDMRHTRNQVAGIVVGNVHILLVVVEGRRPHGVLHLPRDYTAPTVASERAGGGGGSWAILDVPAESVRLT